MNNNYELFKIRFFRFLLILIIINFAIVSISYGDSSEPWFLMSRQGECMEIMSLDRKIPDLPEIGDPHTFTHLMNARGHTVYQQPMDVSGASAMQVDVPELSLYLVFVTGPVCNN